jgi:hypothetical protein
VGHFRTDIGANQWANVHTDVGANQWANVRTDIGANQWTNFHTDILLRWWRDLMGQGCDALFSHSWQATVGSGCDALFSHSWQAALRRILQPQLADNSSPKWDAPSLWRASPRLMRRSTG